MSQGSDHIEDAFGCYACYAPAFSGYTSQFVDLSEFEPEEAANTRTQHHVGMSSMAQAPKVLATENKYEE